MSSDDEEDCAFYGTPLDPIEEDAVPSKKPTPIEEQVVRDKNGRRRFHGAFTGGFSAGYCNTVGSEEGWTPSTFKSSRSEKASQQFRKPEDFMDEEDKSEFGFAPKVLRATSDYNNSSSRKRPHMKYSTGPIPGQPVLRDILQPVKDTVGVRLLRSMGWRPGQGVGPRLSHQQKKIQKKEIKKASSKVYGCTLPGSSSTQSGGSGEDSSGDSDNDDITSMTFAPDDYDAFIVKTKDDVFGIGYKGLDKKPVLSGHVQLFEPSFLGMQEKKKKVAIWGQAFGVGALEEDDEDIYARDDMSRYDFALESSTMVAQRKRDEKEAERRGLLALTAPREVGAPLEGFVLGKNQPSSQRKFFKPPELPPGYKAIHETKSSRWDVTTKTENIAKKQGLGRHDLDAKGRASILDEPLPQPKVIVSSQSQVWSPALPVTSSSVTGSSFRPFASEPDKQARYEKFLEFSKSGQKDLLPSIQPLSMTEWDKEHERSEFEQAAQLYKPLSGIMSDKFVSASQPDDALNPLKPVERMRHGNEEMQNAAKMKMFGKLTRTRDIWQPCSLLCKRFNVPQPFCSSDLLKPSQRSSTFTVFDFLEASSHNTPNEPEGDSKQEIPSMNQIEPEPEPTTAEETSICVLEQHDKQPVATKKLPSISETLARLLADDTGKVQPEPEEKPDLFKAIFLSSSEDSESDSEDEDVSTSKAAPVSDKTTSKKEETRNTRNLSPPRGIFANLDLDAINSRPSEKKNQKSDMSQNNMDTAGGSEPKTEDPQDDLMYGPKIPTALPKSNTSNSSSSAPTLSLRTDVSAVWVERPLKADKSVNSLVSAESLSDSDDSSTSSSVKKKSSKKKRHKEHKKHSKHKKEKKHKKHRSKSKHKRRS